MGKEQIKWRLQRLREKMSACGIGCYIIPMNDFHGSEYIGDYFKLVAYVSGFTGSAGTLVVTQEEAYLWTDGRYFLQAEKQLEMTGIRLQKMGEKEVPAITEFVRDYMGSEKQSEKAVGFDGRLVSVGFAEKLSGLKLVSDQDLAGKLWDEDVQCLRPAFLNAPVWRLESAYAGESTEEKLSKIRGDMKKQKADYLLLTTLDDIAWLTNLRGGDIAYNPVFLSYMMVTEREAFLFCHIEDPDIKEYLNACDIKLQDYEEFYTCIGAILPESKVWIDPVSVSLRVAELIPECCEIIKKTNPVILRKAVKNKTEIQNIRQAHIKDAVAVTKFIYWLKTQVRSGKEKVTETGAAEKLVQLRRQQEDYLGESFAPIIAYGKHGAIVHYNAQDGDNAWIEAESFLLCDTGAHFLQGTTDITRTIAMGDLSQEQKKHYTAVLQGNLRLTDARFKHGVTGANLDYIARQPLYRLGLDFNHGTGHGVGYLLNVHEGPNAFRMRYFEDGVFEEGMVTSNEPGFYPEGQYGIRLENLIVCMAAESTPFGQFYCFEPLTMVPFDKEAIDEKMLTQEDKQLLNSYHKQVYEAIADQLTVEERAWLSEATSAL